MPDECLGSSQRERVTNAFNALKQWGLIILLIATATRLYSSSGLLGWVNASLVGKTKTLMG